MKGYPTLHISVTVDDRKLFDRLAKKINTRSHAETLRHALRALEEKEAERDRLTGGVR